MTQDLVSALEAEIESLEAELREDIRFVRLQTLRQALALYVDPDAALDQLRAAGLSVVQSGQVSRGSTPGRQNRVNFSTLTAAQRNAGRRTSVEKSQAMDAAAMLLRNRSGPVPTREILDHLIDYGIDIGGSSPLNNLSATLSNSDRFKSLGRNGWVLDEIDSQPSAERTEIDPDIYRKLSMEYLDEQSSNGITHLSNYVDFSGELPDEVKDDLAARFKKETGFDYEVNSGNFHQAFVRELEDVASKVPD